MMNDERRQSELGQFLRTRRERLGPADAGLAPGRRRRTPGLRREEVAQLAGVSLTGYTWLEQGRPVRASEAVLDRLGRVLRLDPAEHRHLFVLARGHPPADPTDAPAVVDARLQAVLDALPYPAYAATNGWTVVAWNRAARLVFADYDALSGRERNIIWMAFTDPAAARTGEVSRLCPAVQGGTAREMARKVSEYFAAGCRLVWLVDRRTRTIAVDTSVAKPFVVVTCHVIPASVCQTRLALPSELALPWTTK